MKDERPQIRIPAVSKRRLEAAAAANHLSVSAFVLQAADELMIDRQMIALTPDAARAFSKALPAPPKVNNRLAAALARPLKFSWID